MKERANPSQNEIWRHFKGGEYKIITIAQETETGANMVIYTRSKRKGEKWKRIILILVFGAYIQMY